MEIQTDRQTEQAKGDYWEQRKVKLKGRMMVEWLELRLVISNLDS